MRYWLRSSFHQSRDTAILLEELEACDEEELLQEDLRVEDGDVGSSADEGVCRIGQGVNDIISHEIAVFVLEDWQQQVFNHLSVHGTLYRQEDGQVDGHVTFFFSPVRSKVTVDFTSK